MRYLGLRAIYNTHIHELAQAAEELNDAVEGESRIESLVSRMENGKRSFVIEPGEPLGSSYAMDIAGKFGGGGHPQASGITMNGTLDECTERVLKAMEEKI